MVDAGFVLAQMDSSNTHVNLVILDACRNNPFARSFRSTANGLAQMDAPSGTLIAYATAPGSIASDGATGRNGLYTRELLKLMATPELTVEQLFKRVRISVRGLTNNKQTPWEASSLTADFSFRRSSGAVTNDRSPAAQPNSTPTEDPFLVPNQPRSEDLAKPAVDNERVFTLKEVDQKPMITSKPPPGYTESARKNQIQGGVKLQAILDRSGSIRQIRVLSGSELGHGLPEKAIAAAREIKFTPAVKDGRPVSVQVTLQYYFSLY